MWQRDGTHGRFGHKRGNQFHDSCFKKAQVNEFPSPLYQSRSWIVRVLVNYHWISDVWHAFVVLLSAHIMELENHSCKIWWVEYPFLWPSASFSLFPKFPPALPQFAGQGQISGFHWPELTEIGLKCLLNLLARHHCGVRIIVAMAKETTISVDSNHGSPHLPWSSMCHYLGPIITLMTWEPTTLTANDLL